MDRFGLALVLVMIAWIGYTLAQGVILLCRWLYARWCAKRELRRTLTAWERVEARRTARSRFRSGSMLLLFLLLVACGQAPLKVERTPDVCPAPPATPPQAKVQLPEFLPVLDQTKALSKDAHEASGEVLRVRVDSAALYQACRANNNELARWAISHSQE